MSRNATLGSRAARRTGLSHRQPFRGGVQTVPVYATIRDGHNRLAPNLTREDFEILDNGKPVGITSFSNDPQPLTVALLIDLNWGAESRLLFLRESTQRFIDTLLPGDKLRIGTLGVELALSPLLTGNKDEAVSERFAKPGHPRSSIRPHPLHLSHFIHLPCRSRGIA